MKKSKMALLLARVLFGAPLAGFGAMGLIKVMPDPHAAWKDQEGFSEEATDLLLTLWDSGFIMPLVCAVHVLVGVLVLANRFVPLALALHLPISLNMVLFHLFLDPGSGLFAYVLMVLNIALLGVRREAFRSLFRARPGG